MRLKSIAPFFLLGFVLTFALFTPTARADEWNEATHVTFSGPVQVPGHVLPAGTYLFILANSNSNRYLVQIFSSDRSVLYATVLTIPCKRSEPPNDSVVALAERPSGEPMAVWKWFYPGMTTGHEFVYPENSLHAYSSQLATPHAAQALVR